MTMKSLSFKLLLLSCLLALGSGIACRGSATPAQLPEESAYRIEVEISPARTTLMPNEGITTMAQMALMATTDQGRPVNRHMKVHIYDRDSGATVDDLVPTITIIDQATGMTRELATDQALAASEGIPFALACLLAQHHVVPHFGDNLHLPDGTYTISVIVGGETAVAENIVVKGS